MRDALDHIEVLKRRLTRGELADETVADAVSLRLAAAIEAISEASPELREATFGDEWKIIWSTRNRIAHGYAYVDVDIIRDTVEHDLPDFERRSSRCAASMNPEPPTVSLGRNCSSIELQRLA